MSIFELKLAVVLSIVLSLQTGCGRSSSVPELSGTQQQDSSNAPGNNGARENNEDEQDSNPSNPPQPSQYSMKILRGDGQVTAQSTILVSNLQIKIVDSNGRGIAGATVDWKSHDGNVVQIKEPFSSSNKTELSTLTNAQGIAEVQGVGGSIVEAIGSLATKVTANATVGGQALEQTFDTTIVASPRSFPPSYPSVNFAERPSSFTLRRGETITHFFPVLIAGTIGLTSGKPLPNIMMSAVVDQSEDLGETEISEIRCSPRGYAKSDINGHVSCDLRTDLPVGSYSILFRFGAFNIQGPFTMQVVP